MWKKKPKSSTHTWDCRHRREGAQPWNRAFGEMWTTSSCHHEELAYPWTRRRLFLPAQIDFMKYSILIIADKFRFLCKICLQPLRYLASHNAVIDDKIIFEFPLHPHFALSSHYEFIWKREKLLGEFNVFLMFSVSASLSMQSRQLRRSRDDTDVKWKKLLKASLCSLNAVVVSRRFVVEERWK